MCGRYVIEDVQELSERLTNVRLVFDFERAFEPTWNAAPSQRLPVMVAEDDHWAVRLMQWGLIPAWAKPDQKAPVSPINARSETVAEKPMFRSLIRNTRCVVPASGFYEWQRQEGAKQPFYIHRTDGEPMYFAGVWSELPAGMGHEDAAGSYAILTTEANERMSAVHDRMPVILDPDDVEAWLDREETNPVVLEHLMDAADEDDINLYPVSKSVNAVRNNHPSLITRLDDDEADTPADQKSLF